jgi:glutamate synthase (NADPH/NADH) small chain
MNTNKSRGFIEHERVEQSYEIPVKRVKHYNEFVLALTDSEVKVQTARCMDCGTPFCNSACPVNNIIPDFNNLAHDQDWRNALDVLHSTNNFPEFTGRICPAPCEAACTLAYNDAAVGIKSIEHAIIDRGWNNGWVVPQAAKAKTGKTVAVVGSGPAGLAAAQQLARVGHTVTVFEKNDRIGGLLRYGIPDFKMEKWLIDRRMQQMQAEGVTFMIGITVGVSITAEELMSAFDAVIITGGAEQPRDVALPGRELAGVHYAMDFLVPANKQVAGDSETSISAKDKRVVIVGGGDTGSDCVGTANRQGAAHITQLTRSSQPPEEDNMPLVWPGWPNKMRTSSSHEEGCDRFWSVLPKCIQGQDGQVSALTAVRLEWLNGRMQEVEGSEFEIKADLILLAVGFVSPAQQLIDAFGVAQDSDNNISATTDGNSAYQTNVDRVFVAGDIRRGQSLVVWAIREGRQAAHAVDRYLMGKSVLPL